MEQYITLTSVECLSSSFCIGLYFHRWKEMALFPRTYFFPPFRFSSFYFCWCCVEFKFAFTQTIRGQHSIAVILTVPIC